MNNIEFGRWCVEQAQQGRSLPGSPADDYGRGCGYVSTVVFLLKTGRCTLDDLSLTDDELATLIHSATSGMRRHYQYLRERMDSRYREEWQPGPPEWFDLERMMRLLGVRPVSTEEMDDLRQRIVADWARSPNWRNHPWRAFIEDHWDAHASPM